MVCPDYRQQIHYEATLTGNDERQISTTNGGACAMLCSVSFTVPHSGDGNYVLELQAINDMGESEPVIRNIVIGEFH